ncbi:MAG: hypothetical protein KAS15_00580 [Nanoarchaeota archaeon]|nr:hypothetical protein [Nanoarchaeota archaeon]
MKKSIAKLLSSIENEELEYYLNKFQHSEPSKFAVIKISGECIEDSLDQIIMDLSLLQQLELYPIVIFGWGSILNKKLKQEGIESKFCQGNRVTDIETIYYIKEVVNEIKKGLNQLSEDYSVNLIDLTDKPLFSAKKLDDSLGYVGKITDIDLSHLKETFGKKAIPILFPLGYKGDEIYNINADDAAKNLVEKLKPSKYIAITKTGGVLDKHKNIIKKISIKDDYDELVKGGIISGGMLKKLKQAKKLLEKLKKGNCVQITSPQNLLTELFTYKGTGTKVILGYNTHVYESLDKINTYKLTQLIESGFDKKLVPNYFHTEPIKKIIIEEDYDGAAIIQDYKGWDYIDKFVVSEKSRGYGLGSKLFSEIISNKKKLSGNINLFWRSRHDNYLNSWYMKNIINNKGGCQVGSKWIVYWIGDSCDYIEDLIKYASNKKETLVIK